MKVGIVLTDYAPHVGGAFTFQAEIVEALKRSPSNHSFYFFYFGNENKVSNEGANTFVEIQRASVSHNHAPKGFKQRVLKKLKSWLISFSAVYNLLEKYKNLKSYDYDLNNPLNQQLNHHKIDLVWFPNHFFQPVDIPFVTTVFDLQHRKQPFFPEVSVSGLNWRHREDNFSMNLPRATYIITGTEVGRQEVCTFYGILPERVRIMPFPAPSRSTSDAAETVSAEFTKKCTEDFLFYPAQFWPHKNHTVLLKALKILIEKHSLNLNLLLTGSDKGNLKYIQSKAEALGLSKKVHFLGFVSDAELKHLYQKARALVFPTLFGPDNLPPLEAFSHNCPVVASRVSGSEEQLGDAALLFESTNENDLVEKILSLLKTPGLREQLIAKGQQRIQNRTPQLYVQSMLSLMNEFSSYRETWSDAEKYVHS